MVSATQKQKALWAQWFWCDVKYEKQKHITNTMVFCYPDSKKKQKTLEIIGFRKF